MARARRTGVAAEALSSPPTPAPADLRDTKGLPDLPALVLERGGGMPFVPPLDARQQVGLRAELLLAPAPPEVTRKRYYMANEAAVRALEEHWRDPARGDRGGAGRLCGDAARAGAAVAASG